MKLVKVTEFDGFVYQSDDGPQFVSTPTDPWKPHVYLTADVVGPEGAVSKSWSNGDRRLGRWRITVEFEPLDAGGDRPAAAAPAAPAGPCRVWELFGGQVRLFESGLVEHWDPEMGRWQLGWGDWAGIDMSDEDAARDAEHDAAVEAYRTRPPTGG